MTPPALRPALAAALGSLLLAGCASTTVQSSGTPLQQPLCRAQGSRPTTALYWEPRWRADQKEPQVREALVRRGIERFVARQGCLDIVDTQRLAGEGRDPADDAELLRRAGSARPAPELVLRVAVRELGPRLVIGLPVLVEGGTEVALAVRLLRVASAEVLLDSQILWRHGGAFVVKGLGSLDADLAEALNVALQPSPARP